MKKLGIAVLLVVMVALMVGHCMAESKDVAELFDSQINTLRDRGCPAPIVAMLEDQRSEVLQKVSQMNIPEGHIPFLPVIPRIYLTLYSQVSMIRNDHKVGHTFHDPSGITDNIKTPLSPYYIFDIETGEVMLGKSPQNVDKFITKLGHRCLTDVEIIAFAIHTDVLSKYAVNGPRTRMDSDWTAFLYVSNDGLPVLGWFNSIPSYDRWVLPSCPIEHEYIAF